MTEINLDKERGDLARYQTLRDAGTTPPEDLITFYNRLEVTRERYHLSGIYGCQLDDPPMNFQ